MDIETLAELDRALAGGAPLAGMRLQDLDLTGHDDTFASHPDARGLVVLGGLLSPTLARDLTERGALVFPPAPGVPVNPYRAHLYAPEELYAGLAEQGYAATPDAQAYRWSRDAGSAHDAYTAVLRAMHDAAIGDALDELLDGARVVGVMGGHALTRGSEAYTDAARLGHALADAGLVVATGGGPGAMEAANLGAFARTTADLERALVDLAACPSFTPDIGAWAALALDTRHRLLCAPSDAGLDRASPNSPAPARTPEVAVPADVYAHDTAGTRPDSSGGDRRRGPDATGVRSLGIPTWFYGHEPPNVFCDGIAKYFSNAEREDGLLARSTAGIIVLGGAAGTVQEIFQAVTPRYYASDDMPLTPLVLVGRDHWTREVPVWPAVEALAADRRLHQHVHLVDDLDQACRIVLDAVDSA